MTTDVPRLIVSSLSLSLSLSLSPCSLQCTACFVCRSRKVRCDRTPLQCQNCNRLGVRCPGYDSAQVSVIDLRRSVDGVYRASGIQKRRIGSCDECRRAKRKCSQAHPACRRCTQLSLTCVYPSRRDERQSEVPLSSLSAPSEVATAPSQEPPLSTADTDHAW